MKLIRSLALMVCLIGLAIAEKSPVVMWGSPSESQPSLPCIPSMKFAELVAPLLEKKTLVVFLENDLSSKDFLCNKNGMPCYAQLQNVSNRTYYATVENPVEALSKMEVEHYYSSVANNESISEHLKTDAGKIIFLNFDDVKQSPDRASTLKMHDSIIASITSSLGENVFFLYTASPSTSSKRQRRQVSQDSSPGFVFRNKDKLLIYYKSLSIVSENNPPTILDVKGIDVKSDSDTAMNVTLATTNGTPLTFDITLAGGYFFMKNIEYNKVKFLSSNIYAPTDFSYFCGNLTLTNIPDEKQLIKYTLKWDYLQFQAPFGHTKNESFAFGDAWHCVGFFTSGILSGLLIVALLLTITFIGVCWMMDINTMDRFDDPKGKTITINASD